VVIALGVAAATVVVAAEVVVGVII